MKFPLWHPQQNEELEEEIRGHFEMSVRARMERGQDARQAAQAAHRQFGNVGLVMEVTRGMWGWSSLEQFWQDVRYGARMLIKSPTYSLVAILTLGLGIGANTALFSMVDSLLLRPLPVKDPAQIIALAPLQKKGPVNPLLSVPEYRDLKEQAGSAFSGLIAYQLGMDGLAIDGKTSRMMTSYVTGNYFSVLGIQPVVGRLLLPSEGETIGADPVMVLSYSYWKNQFAGDPGVVGEKVSLNGHAITIVGVAPRGFHGLFTVIDSQAYLPLGMQVIEGNPPDFMTTRSFRNLFVYGRLRAGTSLQQAQATVDVVAQRMAQANPEVEKDMNVRVYPELRARPNPDPNNTIMIVSGLFLGLAALVLVLACVNVANILLVRATIREREMAIRAALGAARGRLVRQLLTESILLALFGGIAGLFLGLWGSGTVSRVHVQTDIPVRFDFSFDWRLFAYALGAALFTGIAVGIVPALRASRGNLNAILHEGGRGVMAGRHRLRNGLVVSQVAGSLMLLVVAGLFMRSLGAAQKTNLGFNPSHVLNLTMDPVEVGYDQAQSREFYKNLLERVHAIPGVESASTTTSVPMGYFNNSDSVLVNGYQQPAGEAPPTLFISVVAPDYLQTMQIPLLKGRDISAADTMTSPFVAVINEAMAKRYWPNQEAIGQHFKMGTEPKASIEVVGVARNSRFAGATGEITPMFYIPLAQHFAANSLQTLQVRTKMAPQSTIPEIEQVIGTLAPNLPVFDVRTMNEALNTLNGFLFFEIGAGLAGALGILGLVLAIVGVYGVVSYAASQRTREIGIRMAMGAQRFDVLKMIFSQGLLIVSIGLAVGIACAFGAAHLARNFLVVSATDPLTYVSVSLLLTAIALTACYIPALRAMRLNPTSALRHE